jgi:RHS repeat-associated protein
MPGRDTIFKTGYRYGFNGKESDSNITKQDYDYGFRIYDARAGRFLSVDPITKEYPELTPYQFASNRPIDGIDKDGKEWELSTVKHNLQFNATTQQQLPSSQELKMQVLQQAMMAAAKRPQPQFQRAPIYTPYEQEIHETIRIQKLSDAGYNADGTPKPLTRLAENKTWNNFSNNIALPMVTTAAGDGLFKLGGKVVTYLAGDVSGTTISQVSEIVIGKNPDYKNLASLKNAKFFNIPMKYWNRMTADEQLAANIKFLDRAIARGDNIALSNKVTDISKVSGGFRTELDHLVNNGYELSSDGFQMIKKIKK